MRHRFLKLVSCVALASCGSEQSGPAYALCDGSSEVRFGTASVGGHVDTTYSFTNPYGHSFLFVNGRCEFVGSASNGDYVAGTLTPAQADTLTSAFDLANVEGKSFRAQSGCADASTLQVMTGNGYLELLCGADEPKYARIAPDALNQAQEIIATGSPVQGDVSVLAIGNFQVKDAPNANAVAWPLSWPLADAAVEWDTSRGAPNLLDVVKRVSGTQAAQLQGLRRAAASRPVHRGYVEVLAGERGYALYVRDELDDAWSDAIARFTQELDPYAAKPIEVCGDDTLSLQLDAPYLIDAILSVTTQAQAPCGARLCWDGSFREEVPVGATLRVERGDTSRSCEGGPSYTYLRADLQPLIDAYRAGYPGSAKVEIEVSVVGAMPPAERTLLTD
ncbi:MAG: hypothetical protein ABW352_24710 [Polyangiales bacterium]